MSAKMCCGNPCQTPYCPLCGKMVTELSPLHALLNHCRSTVVKMKGHTKASEMWLASKKAKGEADEGHERDVVMRRAIEAKWEGWVAALEELLAQEN